MSGAPIKNAKPATRKSYTQPKVAKQPPVRSNSSKVASKPAAAVHSGSPKQRQPTTADPVLRFHQTYGMSCQKLIQELTAIGNEEVKTKDTLKQVEELRKKFKNEIADFEVAQNNALQSEDYATADEMDKKLATSRKQLSSLENQRNLGLGKLGESRKKKLDQMVKQLQTNEQNKTAINAVIKQKETEYSKLTDDNTKSYGMLLQKYTTFLDSTNQQDDSVHDKMENTERQKQNINQQIYLECKDSSDEKERLIQEKGGYDAEIAELEARLQDLKQKSAACQGGINRCDESINVVRKKYAKDLQVVAQNEKMNGDEKKKVDQDRSHCEVQYKNLVEKRDENLKNEQVKQVEINQLKTEDKIFDIIIQKLGQVNSLYQGILSVSDNPELSQHRQTIDQHQANINQATQQKQAIDAQASASRKKAEELEQKIPLWEQQKAKAVASKNFAMAGKLSTQIKSAQTELEKCKEAISQVETQELEQDSVISSLNHEIDSLRSRIEEIEGQVEQEKSNQYREICSVLKGLEMQLSNCPNLADSFKNDTMSIIHTLFEHFLLLLNNLCTQYNLPQFDESMISADSINLLTEPLLNSNCPTPPTFEHNSGSPEAQIAKLQQTLQEHVQVYNDAQASNDTDLMSAIQPEIEAVKNQIIQLGGIPMVDIAAAPQMGDMGGNFNPDMNEQPMPDMSDFNMKAEMPDMGDMAQQAAPIMDPNDEFASLMPQ